MACVTRETNRVTTENIRSTDTQYEQHISDAFKVFLTSRISNLSVLTLLQVFFSLETGLMFIPAERQRCVRVSKQSIYREKPVKLSKPLCFTNILELISQKLQLVLYLLI